MDSGGNVVQQNPYKSYTFPVISIFLGDGEVASFPSCIQISIHYKNIPLPISLPLSTAASRLGRSHATRAAAKETALHKD